MSVPRHDILPVDMVNESIEADYNITYDKISIKHVTRIKIQVTRIRIQHCVEDSNTTCEEDSNTTCDEDSNTTCDEDSNITCE